MLSPFYSNTKNQVSISFFSGIEQPREQPAVEVIRFSCRKARRHM